MELVYIWIEYEGQVYEFQFEQGKKYSLHKINDESVYDLEIDDLENDYRIFDQSKAIKQIYAMVGKNGSGKTTILKGFWNKLGIENNNIKAIKVFKEGEKCFFTLKRVQKDIFYKGKLIEKITIENILYYSLGLEKYEKPIIGNDTQDISLNSRMSTMNRMNFGWKNNDFYTVNLEDTVNIANLLNYETREGVSETLLKEKFLKQASPIKVKVNTEFKDNDEFEYGKAVKWIDLVSKNKSKNSPFIKNTLKVRLATLISWYIFRGYNKERL